MFLLIILADEDDDGCVCVFLWWGVTSVGLVLFVFGRGDIERVR